MTGQPLKRWSAGASAWLWALTGACTSRPIFEFAESTPQASSPNSLAGQLPPGATEFSALETYLEPRTLAFGSTGALYVFDEDNQANRSSTTRRMDTRGFIHAFAGCHTCLPRIRTPGTPALKLGLYQGEFLTFGSDDTVYFATGGAAAPNLVSALASDMLLTPVPGAEQGSPFLPGQIATQTHFSTRRITHGKEHSWCSHC